MDFPDGIDLCEGSAADGDDVAADPPAGRDELRSAARESDEPAPVAAVPLMRLGSTVSV